MTDKELLERLYEIKNTAYDPEMYAEDAVYDIRYLIDKLIKDITEV